MGTIQLQKVPKLTSIIAAITTFSQNGSKTAILSKTNGLLVTNGQSFWCYCPSGDLAYMLGCSSCKRCAKLHIIELLCQLYSQNCIFDKD